LKGLMMAVICFMTTPEAWMELPMI
jgi:hypothetical protein